MEFTQTVNIKTTIKSVMSDLFTPVGIYLRLRDKFRDTILLESAGNQNDKENIIIPDGDKILIIERNLQAEEAFLKKLENLHRDFLVIPVMTRYLSLKIFNLKNFRKKIKSRCCGIVFINM